MTDVRKILDERTKRYGAFADHAAIAQRLKLDMRENGRSWRTLDPDMVEALDMIQHKVARILNGDPRHIDSWDDIAGYATLVADRLRQDAGLNGKRGEDHAEAAT